MDTHDERQYLDLIKEIIETGEKRDDRTGVGTLAVFGRTMRFSLRDGRFPLFTTKSTFFRGVVEELLWFLRGSTNAKELSAKGVHIWDDNGSREFLDSRGLHYREEGDLGPVYGFQWRHFGAEYVDMHTDYTGQGFDQLADCIHKIKNNPTDRRIIMSAWNPADLGSMALPPCHMFCQFFVSSASPSPSASDFSSSSSSSSTSSSSSSLTKVEDEVEDEDKRKVEEKKTGDVGGETSSPKGELSCMMYQRSADMGLGVPFNVASYALLTCMVAHVCGLKPKEFIHVIGDAHVYLSHLGPLAIQLEREPLEFPRLYLNAEVTSIDDFEHKDFFLKGYKSHPKIYMPMAL